MKGSLGQCKKHFKKSHLVPAIMHKQPLWRLVSSLGLPACRTDRDKSNLKAFAVTFDFALAQQGGEVLH
jgi:hypothetical protein